MVAALVAAGMVVQPLIPVISASSRQAAPAGTAKPAAPAQASTAKPAATPAQASSAVAPPIDGGWPRAYSTESGGGVVVYQPQVASWDKQKRMVAFSAVSYRAKAAEKDALGTIKFEADTSVAVADRLVSFEKLKISEANFQTLPKDQLQQVVATVEKALGPRERTRSRERKRLPEPPLGQGAVPLLGHARPARERGRRGLRGHRRIRRGP